MIRGTPKFDSLTVAKLEVSFLGPTLHFVGEAAFANSSTGKTHGWTKNNTWSAATIEKLDELRALMEADLGALHLEGGSEMFSTAGAAAPRSFSVPNEGGLGEHLGGDKVPSV